MLLLDRLEALRERRRRAFRAERRDALGNLVQLLRQRPEERARIVRALGDLLKLRLHVVEARLERLDLTAREMLRLLARSARASWSSLPSRPPMSRRAPGASCASIAAPSASIFVGRGREELGGGVVFLRLDRVGEGAEALLKPGQRLADDAAVLGKMRAELGNPLLDAGKVGRAAGLGDVAKLRRRARTDARRARRRRISAAAARRRTRSRGRRAASRSAASTSSSLRSSGSASSRSASFRICSSTRATSCCEAIVCSWRFRPSTRSKSSSGEARRWTSPSIRSKRSRMALWFSRTASKPGISTSISSSRSTRPLSRSWMSPSRLPAMLRAALSFTSIWSRRAPICVERARRSRGRRGSAPPSPRRARAAPRAPARSGSRRGPSAARRCAPRSSANWRSSAAAISASRRAAAISAWRRVSSDLGAAPRLRRLRLPPRLGEIGEPNGFRLLGHAPPLLCAASGLLAHALGRGLGLCLPPRLRHLGLAPRFRDFGLTARGLGASACAPRLGHFRLPPRLVGLRLPRAPRPPRPGGAPRPPRPRARASARFALPARASAGSACRAAPRSPRPGAAPPPIACRRRSRGGCRGLGLALAFRLALALGRALGALRASSASARRRDSASCAARSSSAARPCELGAATAHRAAACADDGASRHARRRAAAAAGSALRAAPPGDRGCRSTKSRPLAASAVSAPRLGRSLRAALSRGDARRLCRSIASSPSESFCTARSSSSTLVGAARIEPFGRSLPAAAAELRDAALIVEAGIEQVVDRRVGVLAGLLVALFGRGLGPPLRPRRFARSSMLLRRNVAQQRAVRTTNRPYSAAK